MPCQLTKYVLCFVVVVNVETGIISQQIKTWRSQVFSRLTLALFSFHLRLIGLFLFAFVIIGHKYAVRIIIWNLHTRSQVVFAYFEFLKSRNRSTQTSNLTYFVTIVPFLIPIWPVDDIYSFVVSPLISSSLNSALPLHKVPLNTVAKASTLLQDNLC